MPSSAQRWSVSDPSAVSRAASAVVTPGSQDFHTAARIKLQSVAWSSSRDRIAMSPVQLHRTHDLLALGLSIHSQIVLHAVRHPFEHGLERGGVSSEEPDVVHPAEMRKGCVVHLLVVSLTADDVCCFLSVPLFAVADCLSNDGWVKAEFEVSYRQIHRGANCLSESVRHSRSTDRTCGSCAKNETH